MASLALGVGGTGNWARGGGPGPQAVGPLGAGVGPGYRPGPWVHWIQGPWGPAGVWCAGAWGRRGQPGSRVHGGDLGRGLTSLSRPQGGVSLQLGRLGDAADAGDASALPPSSGICSHVCAPQGP